MTAAVDIATPAKAQAVTTFLKIWHGELSKVPPMG
jgi:hypothetical protein